MSLFVTGNKFEDALNAAPNPKPSRVDKALFGALASLYTAFSSEFAAYALDFCLDAAGNRIVDPFSGMGTLAEAARTRPIDLQVADLSPFAALAGAFRSATQQSIAEGAALLERLSENAYAETESEFYECVLNGVRASANAPLDSLLASPSAPENRVPALCMYFAALSRLRLHKKHAGSNPTWMRRTNAVADGATTLDVTRATLSQVREFARRLPEVNARNTTTSLWSSIADLPLGDGSLDAIVTSPPYANRTDYVRHYQPASELLIAASQQSERQIRSKQIGTPLIRSTEPDRPLPPSVVSVLESIRTHPSYASERYYHKGFLYYFSDMRDALACMHRWLKRDGLLMLVVQDTYYKELHVPTSGMLVDIALSVDLEFLGRRDWRVRNYLSHLSPHSRRSVAQRTLSESLLLFSK